MNEPPSPRCGPIAKAVVWSIGGVVALGLGWVFQYARATTQEDRSAGEAVSAATGVQCSQASCRAKADWLVRQLGDGATAFVEPPWAVVGTAKVETLAGFCRDVLQPTTRRLAEEFGLDEAKVEPIGVLVFTDEREYRDAARRILGENDVSRYGFHVPHLRLILANCATGPRVLRHEAVHSLVDRHDRGIPAWLDEGLSALYESPLEGDSGEILTLREALTQRRLPPLASLTAANWTLAHHDGLSRVYLRWFCAYLREKGRLAAVWQRALAAHSSAGLTDAPLDAAGLGPTAAVESQFLNWLGAYPKTGTGI